MPRRAVPLVTDEYYHVYNRGVARQPVFLGKRDYERFLLGLNYYRFVKPPMRLSFFLQLPKDQRTRLLEQTAQSSQPLITLICFVLMPNHFHLLLRQGVNGGTSTFLRRSVNSYVRYFNTKHHRVGPVFQGPFKTVRVETDPQLLHLSRYIHLNPLTGHAVSDAVWATYPWSSLADFRNGHSTLCDLNPVLQHFPSPKAYVEFIRDRVDYAKELNRIKHLVLEA